MREYDERTPVEDNGAIGPGPGLGAGLVGMQASAARNETTQPPLDMYVDRIHGMQDAITNQMHNLTNTIERLTGPISIDEPSVTNAKEPPYAYARIEIALDGLQERLNLLNHVVNQAACKL